MERFDPLGALSEPRPAARSAVRRHALRKSLLALVLVAGCGGAAEQQGGNGVAPASARQISAAGPSEGTSGSSAASAGLTGLYEGGAAAQRNQLCMIEKGGKTQFGLVVWGGNMHSCAGAGEAVRDGKSLTLKMTGDESCVIDATLDAATIRLPDTIPAGCSYYCGARARLSGAAFTRAGAGAGAAMKAVDLAGDPLCG
jgi:hypothetical protein